MKQIFVFTILMILFLSDFTDIHAQTAQNSDDAEQEKVTQQKPKDPCKDPKIAMDPFSGCNNIGYKNYYLSLFESGKINTPPPMGGPITNIMTGCFYQITWVQLGPPRPGYYLHVPKITRTYAFGPPRHIGQFLLGLYAPKQFCTKNTGSGLIVIPGLMITMMGSSR